MDARLATVLDIDLATAFGVTDLLFPDRARFIVYSQSLRPSTYALHMGAVKVQSRRFRLRRKLGFGKIWAACDGNIALMLRRRILNRQRCRAYIQGSRHLKG
jgi:hypothetical protein